MHWCCVFGCSNNQGEKGYVGSFHTFPSDKRLKKLWNSVIHRKHFKGGNSNRICSDHFRDEDFHISPSMAKKLNYKISKFVLHKGVVPSQKPRGQVESDSHIRSSVSISKRANLQAINLTLKPQCKESIVASTQVQVSSQPASSNDPVTQVESPIMKATPPITQCTIGTQAGTQALKVTHDIGVTCALILPTRCKPEIRHRGTQYKPPAWVSRSRGTQTRPSMVSKAVSCDIPKCQIDPEEDFLPSEEEDDDESMSADDSDPDYDPAEDEGMEQGSHSDDDSDIEESDVDLEEDDDRKFIIYGSCLRLLMAVCWLCGEACRVLVKVKRGTGYTFESICKNHHSRVWSTQPMKGRMSAGNLCLAATMFFSGSNIAKTLNLFRFAKIPVFSEKTFRSIQKHYLIPAIHNIWGNQKNARYHSIRARGGKVKAGGDARCDSPGRMAKFGSYSCIDCETNMIIACHLIQCDQTGTSAAMEKAGLIKCLNELSENGIEVDTLITDRHPSIRKYMREQQPGITHYFDIWHVSKGIQKKLQAQGKKKDECDSILMTYDVYVYDMYEYTR